MTEQQKQRFDAACKVLDYGAFIPPTGHFIQVALPWLSQNTEGFDLSCNRIPSKGHEWRLSLNAANRFTGPDLVSVLVDAVLKVAEKKGDP